MKVKRRKDGTNKVLDRSLQLLAAHGLNTDLVAQRQILMLRLGLDKEANLTTSRFSCHILSFSVNLQI
jgi:hypothetical protein